MNLDDLKKKVKVLAIGLDWSFARPDPRQVAGAGFRFAQRYLANTGSSKVVDRTEADAIRAAGLGLVLVWETTADRALAGNNAGYVDGLAAAILAGALGFPSSRPIYFAVDFDAAGAGQLPAVRTYFAGVVRAIGIMRTGGYGGFDVIEDLFRYELIAWGWQATAWSRGLVSPHAALYQTTDKWPVGTDVGDVNAALKADIGAWGWPTSTGGGDDDMTLEELLDGLGVDADTAGNALGFAAGAYRFMTGSDIEHGEKREAAKRAGAAFAAKAIKGSG